MDPFTRLTQLTQLTQLQLLLSIDEIRQIISDLANVDVDFSNIDIENICCILYNMTINVDKNIVIVGIENKFRLMVRKIAAHFMGNEISRPVTLLFESFIDSFSLTNYGVVFWTHEFMDFIARFMKWEKPGQFLVQKYHFMAIRLTVVYPKLLITFIRCMNIHSVKKLIQHMETQHRESICMGNTIGSYDDHLVNDDKNKMFVLCTWIHLVSEQSEGIEFIMKNPKCFTEFLCVLVRNTEIPRLFEPAIRTLDNLRYLDETLVIQEGIRSLVGCVPKVNIDCHEVREKWECIQNHHILKN